ncbi:MAG: 50S ribosomal protein L13 [Parcubacteria group bacterium]|nr:50S ribosomal protein L13 [Parcubacteria group bacterium]
METSHTLDATEKSIGRVASTAAAILIGKHTAAFKKNAVSKERVHIINASKARFAQKKLKEKVYIHYTGNPGGLKMRHAEKIVEQKGYSELFKKAVYGMLPSNKLRAERMKLLRVSE